jgi:vacuolar-type H+-ATPase subunit E/Vma4
VALADIIRRIEDDADVEARAMIEDAEVRAAAMVADSLAEAHALAERVRGEAERAAEHDAETLMANARLRARDRTLEARHELVRRVLERAERLVAEQPDPEYARFLARRVVATARGGETVRVGAEDAARMSGLLPEAVDAAAKERDTELELAFSDEPADVPRGVVLEGERMSVEISAAALVGARREELRGHAAAILFGEGDAAADAEPAYEDAEG